MEVDRSLEFSPLKNAPNKNLNNSPETCKQDLYQVNIKRLENAGAKVMRNEDSSKNECEISPLVSYAGEGLSYFKDKTIKLPILINKIE